MGPMNLEKKLKPFAFTGKRRLRLAKEPTKIDAPYQSKREYQKLLEEFQGEIDELQCMMYAHDRYSMLLIFQAMDAAGKDGTIRHVMSGVNPHGVEVTSFKKPGDLALDHNYMWRSALAMPSRGKIGIFNRSYYEEVLVCRVHPEIVTEQQKLPRELTRDLDKLWEQRYEQIRNIERYAHQNGTRVVKFFLHLSRDEQRRRFLARIDEPEKNWKFSEADVHERGFWDRYQDAYEKAINETATPDAPWYVVPADDKKTMRLIVGAAVLTELRRLDMRYPKVRAERRAQLEDYRAMLEGD